MKVLIVASLLIAQVLSQGNDDMMRIMMFPPGTSYPELRDAIFPFKQAAGSSIQMNCGRVDMVVNGISFKLSQLVQKVQELTGFDGIQLMKTQTLSFNYRFCGGFGVFMHLRDTEEAVVNWGASLKNAFCYSDEKVLEEVKEVAQVLYDNLFKVAEERYTVGIGAFETRIGEVFAKLELAGEGKSDYLVDTAFEEIDHALVMLKSDFDSFTPYYTPYVTKIPISECK